MSTKLNVRAMTRPAKKPRAVRATLPPIYERLRAALAHGYVQLNTLEEVVFPESHFPNAFRCAVQGGPPGCRMAMVAALKRYCVPISTMAHCNAAALVGPFPGTCIPVETFSRASDLIAAMNKPITLSPKPARRK